ncbi:MAG: glycosyltransferase [Flavobacteriaceae bacterium]|nr:glycosyltransferase [Flavobacteriaceae bacterium]
MLTILFYTLVCIVIFQLIYYMAIYSPIAFSNRSKTKENVDLAVSIVVYIKDNEKELPTFLESLTTQNYSRFELILVNNASEDESLTILETFAQQYSNVKIVNVQNNEAFWGNKKYALTLGIKVASCDYLLLTDPTTILGSSNWIAGMCQNFTTRKQVVIGYSELERRKKSLSNKFLRYQNSLKYINLFSWGEISKPAFGNAKNQAYSKELFFKNNGFIKQMNIPYGDEYGFIRLIATKANATITLNPDTFTINPVKNSFSNWREQVKTTNLLLRNTSWLTCLKFKILNFSTLCFYIVFSIIICNLYLWEFAIAVFLFRYLIAFFYTNKMLKKFAQKDLIWLFPILEFTHVLSGTYYSLIHLISRKKIERR